MENRFDTLGISPIILETIKEMGFETPTEVQFRAIPQVLKKEDLIVVSKTGSGKTATFGIPILQLTELDMENPQALILTPTRELAVQVDSDLKVLSKNLKKRTAVVYGQHSMNVEIQAFQKKPTIITGTPGRVYDHIQQGNIITKDIKYLVLDEADRMLDMGFLEQVERIIKRLPKDRVTMLFSATIPSEIRKICREYMKNPVTIEIQSETKTVDSIVQDYYRVDPHEKRTQLYRILMQEQPESCMVFCNTRIAANQIQEFFQKKGLSSQALHGDIPQGRRMKTIQQFKDGTFRILVATDVAARGLHIEDLSLVINYDIPEDRDNYVHRIGRTGRAGNGGHSITLATSNDIMTLYEIEEHIGARIDEKELPTDAELNARKEAFEKWLLEKPPIIEAPKSDSRGFSGRKPSGGKPSSGKPSGGKPGYGNTGYSKPGYGKSDSGKQNSPRPNAGKPGVGKSNSDTARTGRPSNGSKAYDRRPSNPSYLEKSPVAKPLQAASPTDSVKVPVTTPVVVPATSEKTAEKKSFLKKLFSGLLKK